jgi:hypothetical protein
MVVNFDGYIYPCCSVSGFTEALRLGNIYENPLRAAVRAALESKYLFYLQRRGLSDYVKLNRGSVEHLSTAYSVCDLCKSACQTKESFENALRFVDVEFAKHARETMATIFEGSL